MKQEWTSVTKSMTLHKMRVDGNDLIIKFIRGSVYRYIGAAKEFDNIMEAKSPGQTFHNEVKNTYKKEYIEHAPERDRELRIRTKDWRYPRSRADPSQQPAKLELERLRNRNMVIVAIILPIVLIILAATGQFG